MSPRRNPREESPTDLASLDLTLLAGSNVSAALAAVVLYQQLNLFGWGAPQEGFAFTLKVDAVRDEAQPFVLASLLMGWTGILVRGVGASRL